MPKYRFAKELYPKIALMKAAYNFTDRTYVHLDADELYYYVDLESKDNAETVNEKQFVNEMLAQSVRHMVYQQTKNIRELMLARAMATTVITDTESIDESESTYLDYSENEMLKDWFENND